MWLMVQALNNGPVRGHLRDANGHLLASSPNNCPDNSGYMYMQNYAALTAELPLALSVTTRKRRFAGNLRPSRVSRSNPEQTSASKAETETVEKVNLPVHVCSIKMLD